MNSSKYEHQSSKKLVSFSDLYFLVEYDEKCFIYVVFIGFRNVHKICNSQIEVKLYEDIFELEHFCYKPICSTYEHTNCETIYVYQYDTNII